MDEAGIVAIVFVFVFLILFQITHMSFLRPDGHRAMSAAQLLKTPEGIYCVNSW